MAQQYTKPHLTYADQLDLLKSRGLGCGDDDRALAVLRAAGYYRLSAYVYPFRELLPDGAPRTTPFHFRSDKIRPGTSFEQIEALWRFDRSLRMSCLEGLETVEVGIRTQIAYALGARHTFGHLERTALNEAACRERVPSSGGRREAFDVWCRRYEDLLRNAHAEDFVRHNVAKYNGQLPIWIAVEFLDFGAIVRLFKLLRADDQNTIARGLGIKNGNLLARLLLPLNYVRNSAAHHSRLWNRTLTLKAPNFPAAVVPDRLAHAAGVKQRDKIYIPLAFTAHLANEIDPKCNWPRRMRTVLRKFPDIPGLSPETDMGFPQGWQDLPLWKSHEGR